MADSHNNVDAKKVDLVLEGGGVKGIALVGAVVTLAEAGYSFPRVAGTSAGAIVASVIAAYQRAKRPLGELFDVMNAVDNTRFADKTRLERIAGPVGAAAELLWHGGLHSGDYLYEFLGPALAMVGVRTFADLRLDDPDSSLAENQRYALVLHVSDLTRRALVRLPWDYPLYGKQADEQRVVDAVRASISIPFFYRPVKVPTDRGAVAWVDGGLLSNFPITVFDRTDGQPPRWPTWGIKVVSSPLMGKDRAATTALGIAANCVKTIAGDWYRSSSGTDGAGRRTIHVDTSSVSVTDFALDNAARGLLFANGQAAAKDFLARLPVS